MSTLKNVTLELSSKPFRSDSVAAMEHVAKEMFRQWRPLIEHADVVSVMLWLADGSEILDYSGNLDDTFEWAKWLGCGAYIGNESLKPPIEPDNPEVANLHHTPQLYMENPPEYTYGWIKNLSATLKQVGMEETGKPVRVGATFDPGPEFAVSSFKYERHRESLRNYKGEIGKWVCCYSILDGDDYHYAGFPDGIPDGTPFGTFLGKQSQAFCNELGFDYLWLSNGFGFGLETWAMFGAVFDGESFSYDKCNDVKEKNMVFWRTFREACPDLPVEVRGTNLSTGMDLSSDAVPLKDIYDGNFGIQPPPNSPWAAINGDFGMELIGWMSHISEIPGETYPFRFYTHDPWWMNSPWLDRYGRDAHDIFLPLAVSRLDGKGNAQMPTSVEFLTVDDSMGYMPEEVANEVNPHIIDCIKNGPDMAGPLLWVYPFAKYHEMTYAEERGAEVFFGDWFMRAAVNEGFPVNTVVSVENYLSASKTNAAAFEKSILVTPVPDAGSEIEKAVLATFANGGNIMLYGPLTHAGEEMLKTLGIEKAEPLAGEFDLETALEFDTLLTGEYSKKFLHTAISSSGGLEAKSTGSTGKVLASGKQGADTRTLAASQTSANGGKLVWIRGTNSFDLPENKGSHHPHMHNEAEFFRTEKFMRMCLGEFGMNIQIEHYTPGEGKWSRPGLMGPMMTISRSKNAFWFSSHAPDASTRQMLKLPMGAPVFANEDMRMENGRTVFNSRRAWRKECRIFVDQKAKGVWKCREILPGVPEKSRRLHVDGLTDATVRFFPPEEHFDSTEIFVNPPNGTFFTGEVPQTETETTIFGKCITVKDVTGSIRFSW